MSNSLDSEKDLKEDESRLKEIGYMPVLPRSMDMLDNLMTSMGALYFIGGVQALFATALSTGGPAPTWSNWVICSFMTLAIAASLAEICSVYPTAGSIYYWAYKCGGKKYGPFLAYLTAIMNVSAWIMNVASDVFACSNFIISEPAVFNIAAFPTSPDDINFRSIQFGVSFVILLASTLINLLPHKHLSLALKGTGVLMVILYLINMIWLPIAVQNAYGFNNATSVFTSVNNDDGASTSYSWFINILFPMYSLVGFDASGHVAEETKKSHISSPRGVFGSALYSSVFAFPLVLMLLFCSPVNQANSNLAQPIVDMYAQAMGLNAQAFVVGLSALLFMLNAIITILACSRLIFAVARDGIFPKIVAYVNPRDGQPHGAIWSTFVVGTILLLTIIPSTVAYSSLTSGSVICILISYGLVIFGRLFLTRDTFQTAEWNLGPFSIIVSYISLFWSVFCVIVLSLPQQYPVTNTSFNYAPVMAVIVLVFSLATWYWNARFWFTGLGKDAIIAPIVNNGGGATEIDEISHVLSPTIVLVQ